MAPPELRSGPKPGLNQCKFTRSLWSGSGVSRTTAGTPSGLMLKARKSQRLAAGVAPLVHKTEGLVDQRSRPAVRGLAVDRIRADARNDIIERRPRAMVRRFEGHPGRERCPRQVQLIAPRFQLGQRPQLSGRVHRLSRGWQPPADQGPPLAPAENRAGSIARLFPAANRRSCPAGVSTAPPPRDGLGLASGDFGRSRTTGRGCRSGAQEGRSFWPGGIDTLTALK